MKHLFLLPLISAEWNVWLKNNYCDYEQTQIDMLYKNVGDVFNEDLCKDYCKRALNVVEDDYL